MIMDDTVCYFVLLELSRLWKRSEGCRVDESARHKPWMRKEFAFVSFANVSEMSHIESSFICLGISSSQLHNLYHVV